MPAARHFARSPGIAVAQTTADLRRWPPAILCYDAHVGPGYGRVRGSGVRDVVALVSTRHPRLPHGAVRLAAQLRRQGALAERRVDAGPPVRRAPGRHTP